jgi:uncharacterized iron-regulated protein
MLRRVPGVNVHRTPRATTVATHVAATQLAAASLAVATTYGCAATTVEARTPDSAALDSAALDSQALDVASPVTATEHALTALGPTGFVAEPTLVDELSKASLVCLGEQHDNVVHHAQQRRLASALVERAQAAGRPVALGLEMFSLPSQPFLDAFTRGEIDEATLLEQTDYARRWGFDFSFYRNTIAVFANRHAPLLALNAPREWTKAVAKAGPSALAELGATLRAEELVLDDPDHQRFFATAMGAFHPGRHAKAHGETVDGTTGETHGTKPAVDWSTEPFYVAQVVWDETMAKTAAQWLAQEPNGLVVVLAGAGHCHRSAIPRRFERRLPQARARGLRLSETADLREPSIPANWAFDWVTLPALPAR